MTAPRYETVLQAIQSSALLRTGTEIDFRPDRYDDLCDWPGTVTIETEHGTVYAGSLDSRTWLVLLREEPEAKKLRDSGIEVD